MFSRFQKRKGCDVCIFECDKPILLSIKGKKYKGHKDCMKELHDKIMRERRKHLKQG